MRNPPQLHVRKILSSLKEHSSEPAALQLLSKSPERTLKVSDLFTFQVLVDNFVLASERVLSYTGPGGKSSKG